MSKLDNLTQARWIADGVESSIRTATIGKQPLYTITHGTLYLWRDKLKQISALVKVDRINYHKVGVLFNLKAWWIGAHYSSTNRRLCVNLLPCITVYYVKPGGIAP